MAIALIVRCPALEEKAFDRNYSSYYSVLGRNPFSDFLDFCEVAIPEQVLEADDEPVDLRVLRVVDGLGYVVDEEVVDVVVPVQDLKYRLVPLPNLHIYGTMYVAHGTCILVFT